MAKDTYKKRLKAGWNQGKRCKGDGEERQYVKKEISTAVKEYDEDYVSPYKKGKRKRNRKLQLEHRIAWYEEVLAKYASRGQDTLTSGWFRIALKEAKEKYAKLLEEEKKKKEDTK